MDGVKALLLQELKNKTSFGNRVDFILSSEEYHASN